jgi:hypothetical protein
MAPSTARARRTGEPPAGFHVDRKLPLGRHPLLKAFPGLDKLPTAKRHAPTAKARKSLHEKTMIELVPEDLWMYVAPWTKPKFRRRGWVPVVTPDTDCIVIGEGHLRESPDLTLFLDIFHELCHVLQRHAGMELFDRKVSYVKRPTEVEAYRFVVEEARRLKVEDDVLREYLTVEWIDESELFELLDAVGVPRT